MTCQPARLSFVIHGRPIPKSRPRVVGRGRYRHAYTSARTRAWERRVHVIALDARLRWQLADAARGWDLCAPATYDVHLRFFGAHGAADIDNLAKAVLDGMQGALYANDRSVRTLTCMREAQDAFGPRVEVEVRWE